MSELLYVPACDSTVSIFIHFLSTLGSMQLCKQQKLIKWKDYSFHTLEKIQHILQMRNYKGT